MTEPIDPTSTDAAAAPADTAPDTPDTDNASAPPAGKAAKKAAPRKRAPRKRAPSKKAAAAVEVETDVPAVNDGAPPVTAVDQPAEPKPAVASADVTPGEASAAAELPLVTDDTAEPATEPTEDEIAAEEAAAEALRAAVLFQAPAPRRRRRAASAPAGPPVHQEAPAPEDAAPITTPATPAAPVTFGAPAPEDLEAAPAPPTPATDEPAAAEPAASTDATDSDADPDSDSDDDTGGRRRRRGRRGRGRRSGTGDDETGENTEPDSTDADTTDPTDPTPSADDVSDTGSEAVDDSEAGDDSEGDSEGDSDEDRPSGSSRRRRRRRRGGSGGGADGTEDGEDPPNTVVHVREPRPARERQEKDSDSGGSAGGGRKRRSGGGDRSTEADDDGVRGVRGSTRLEAKRQRRRDGRDNGRKRAPILTEAEFLARREAVARVMAIRQVGDRTQIGVLEDDVLVEHYVTRASATSYVGNVYLGRVQNVLPSMEAAFVDIGKGRNGVLYAGEVNWDAAGLDGKSRSIEHALHSGDSVLVQVTKDPVGHKGARLTSQVSLPGRYLVYVPGGGMTGISRKLPDTERSRLKAILKKVVPEDGGVIVRTAAEGASEEDLSRDVERLVAQWESIQARTGKKSSSPELVHGEPDLAIRVVRDLFNEDVTSLVVQGEDAYSEVSGYLGDMAPELVDRLSRYTGTGDLFHDLRIDEQLAKALDRKVWLPSGGSLVIDRTEAMTVVDVNTGKYIGSGGNLEETVTRNNLEAAEEIVRQLRLRDVGGIIVVDFIDMVLESNRDLVLRRLTECLGRDRTKHQVAEVTSLGLVQMTRKRVGEGLLEAFSTTCEHCHGRGVMISSEPIDQKSGNGGSDDDSGNGGGEKSSGRRRRGKSGGNAEKEAEPLPPVVPVDEEKRKAAAEAMAAMARTAAGENGPVGDFAREVGEDALVDSVEGAVADVTASDTPAAVDASDTGTADTDDVTEVHAEAEAAAAPVEEAPVAEAAEEASAAEVVDEAFAPAKKAAPRRRRAARRPAGAPAADAPTAG